MTTQVSFTADEDLKNKALQKARAEGITLKTLFIYTMKGFVEGKIALGIEANQGGIDLIELPHDEVDAHLVKEAKTARKTKKSNLINIH
jgi:hypothetical protein